MPKLEVCGSYFVMYSYFHLILIYTLLHLHVPYNLHNYIDFHYRLDVLIVTISSPHTPRTLHTPHKAHIPHTPQPKTLSIPSSCSWGAQYVPSSSSSSQNHPPPQLSLTHFNRYYCKVKRDILAHYSLVVCPQAIVRIMWQHQRQPTVWRPPPDTSGCLGNDHMIRVN